ncbi:hypothetical protein ACK3TF_002641 [Chlorella vulgaris]
MCYVLLRPDCSSVERVHRWFCRRVQGLPKQVTAAISLAELGRQPLQSFWIQQLVRFWNRLQNSAADEDRVLGWAFKDNLELMREGGDLAAGSACWSRRLGYSSPRPLPQAPSNGSLSLMRQQSLKGLQLRTFANTKQYNAVSASTHNSISQPTAARSHSSLPHTSRRTGSLLSLLPMLTPSPHHQPMAAASSQRQHPRKRLQPTVAPPPHSPLPPAPDGAGASEEPGSCYGTVAATVTEMGGGAPAPQPDSSAGQELAAALQRNLLHDMQIISLHNELTAVKHENVKLRQQLHATNTAGMSNSDRICALEKQVQELLAASLQHSDMHDSISKLHSRQEELVQRQKVDECQHSLVLKTESALPAQGITAHVQDLLCQQLNIAVTVLKVQPLGNKQHSDSDRQNRKHAYKVGLGSSGQRTEVLRIKAQALRGTPLSIDALLTPDQLASKQRLMPVARQAKTAGQSVRWRYGTLLINGKPYTGPGSLPTPAEQQQQQQQQQQQRMKAGTCRQQTTEGVHSELAVERGVEWLVAGLVAGRAVVGWEEEGTVAADGVEEELAVVGRLVVGLEVAGTAVVGWDEEGETVAVGGEQEGMAAVGWLVAGLEVAVREARMKAGTCRQQTTEGVHSELAVERGVEWLVAGLVAGRAVVGWEEEGTVAADGVEEELAVVGRLVVGLEVAGTAVVGWDEEGETVAVGGEQEGMAAVGWLVAGLEVAVREARLQFVGGGAASGGGGAVAAYSVRSADTPDWSRGVLSALGHTPRLVDGKHPSPILARLAFLTMSGGQGTPGWLATLQRQRQLVSTLKTIASVRKAAANYQLSLAHSTTDLDKAKQVLCKQLDELINTELEKRPRRGLLKGSGLRRSSIATTTSSRRSSVSSAAPSLHASAAAASEGGACKGAVGGQGGEGLTATPKALPTSSTSYCDALVGALTPSPDAVPSPQAATVTEMGGGAPAPQPDSSAGQELAAALQRNLLHDMQIISLHNELTAVKHENVKLRQQLHATNTAGMSNSDRICALEKQVQELLAASLQHSDMHDSISKLHSRQEELVQRQKVDECQHSLVLKTESALPAQGITAHVQDLLCQQLNIAVTVLKVQPLGNKQHSDSDRQNRKHAYKVGLGSSGQRTEVLRIKAQALRGTPLSIDALLTPDQLASKQRLMPVARQAKTAGQSVRWRYGTLLINGKPYTGPGSLPTPAEQQQQQQQQQQQSFWIQQLVRFWNRLQNSAADEDRVLGWAFKDNLELMREGGDLAAGSACWSRRWLHVLQSAPPASGTLEWLTELDEAAVIERAAAAYLRKCLEPKTHPLPKTPAQDPPPPAASCTNKFAYYMHHIHTKQYNAVSASTHNSISQPTAARSHSSLPHTSRRTGSLLSLLPMLTPSPHHQPMAAASSQRQHPRKRLQPTVAPPPHPPLPPAPDGAGASEEPGSCYGTVVAPSSASKYGLKSPAEVEEYITLLEDESKNMSSANNRGGTAATVTEMGGGAPAPQPDSSAGQELAAALQRNLLHDMQIISLHNELTAVKHENVKLRQQLHATNTAGMSNSDRICALEKQVQELLAASLQHSDMHDSISKLHSRQEELVQRQKVDECQHSLVLKTESALPAQGITAHVQDLLCQQLNIAVTVLKVQPLGNKQHSDSDRQNRKHAYKVGLGSSGQRTEVLRIKAQALRGTPLSIDALLTPDQLASKQRLMPVARQAKTAGQSVRWRYGTLLINGKPYTGPGSLPTPAEQQQQQQQQQQQGLPKQVTAAISLAELGRQPLQSFWIQQLVRFWNRLQNSAADEDRVLGWAFKDNLELMREGGDLAAGSACWSRRWLHVLQSAPPASGTLEWLTELDEAAVIERAAAAYLRKCLEPKTRPLPKTPAQDPPPPAASCTNKFAYYMHHIHTKQYNAVSASTHNSISQPTAARSHSSLPHTSRRTGSLLSLLPMLTPSPHHQPMAAASSQRQHPRKRLQPTVAPPPHSPLPPAPDGAGASEEPGSCYGTVVAPSSASKYGLKSPAEVEEYITLLGDEVAQAKGQRSKVTERIRSQRGSYTRFGGAVPEAYQLLYPKGLQRLAAQLRERDCCGYLLGQPLNPPAEPAMNTFY